MKTNSRVVLSVATLSAVLLASGCSGGDAKTDSATSSASSKMSSAHSSATSSTGMMHDHPMDGGAAPAGMQRADSPKYPVGTTVKLTADHMPGMKGANAKVVGAFSTTTYAVTYTPASGGPKVSNHKWVVAEEVEGGSKQLKKGDTVTLLADHMPGMKGAKATIDSSTTETVYMVDVPMHGMTMKNHKWVVESEMQPTN